MLRGVKACVVFSLVVGVVLDRRDMPERGMQPLVIIRECLMVCVWVPNLHEETDQNDYCGTTRPG